jgi:hypothetical protein
MHPYGVLSQLQECSLGMSLFTGLVLVSTFLINLSEDNWPARRRAIRVLGFAAMLLWSGTFLAGRLLIYIERG